MLFIEFSRICEHIEGVPGRLDMIDYMSSFLPGLSDEELPVFVRFIMGKIFPDWSPLKIGIGPNLLYEAVAYVAGKKKESVIDRINTEGDVGLAVEQLLATKEQMSFFVNQLDLVEVYRDFEYIAAVEGTRSQREKLKVIRKLFANAQPLEGRYLARLMLGELRIGMGEGSVRDAVARASSVPSDLVEHAYQATNDLGEVALLAREGPKALEGVHIEIFRPVKMMLAKQGTISDMIARHGAIAAEYKYDGTRFQFHKKGGTCRIYSRKLEEVTHALPDIVENLLQATDHDVILDGEVIAIKDGRPLPFQYVLRRFRRKNAIESHVEEIELIPHIFDILYLNGTTLIDLTFAERRAHLEGAIRSHVAPQVVSEDIEFLENYYQSALDAGHEGIMVKDRASRYTPGVRGKQWIKIKPEVDTIDLAVVGAEWGEGRRAQVFGSFLLACQDQGELIPISKVATGFSDEMLMEMYDLLRETIIARSGKTVTLEPKLVVEVGYAEIQKSPNYPGGHALRFPRFIRLRDDKSIDEIETLDLIKERFSGQFKPE
jgi:DNA ligase-1